MRPTPEALADVYAAKSDDDLRSLHAKGTLTNVAYKVLESEFQARGLAIPKRPDVVQLEREARREHARVTLVGHWKGLAPLASAYWLVGTLGFWAIYGSVILVKVFLPLLMPLAWAAFVVFLVFAWVSIWRCWKNTRWVAWGYVARTEVVLDVVVVVAVAVRLISEAMQPQSVIR